MVEIVDVVVDEIVDVVVGRDCVVVEEEAVGVAAVNEEEVRYCARDEVEWKPGMRWECDERRDEEKKGEEERQN